MASAVGRLGKPTPSSAEPVTSHRTPIREEGERHPRGVAVDRSEGFHAGRSPGEQHHGLGTGVGTTTLEEAHDRSRGILTVMAIYVLLLDRPQVL
jgi:hypothetical protein